MSKANKAQATKAVQTVKVAQAVQTAEILKVAEPEVLVGVADTPVILPGHEIFQAGDTDVMVNFFDTGFGRVSGKVHMLSPYLWWVGLTSAPLGEKDYSKKGNIAETFGLATCSRTDSPSAVLIAQANIEVKCPEALKPHMQLAWESYQPYWTEVLDRRSKGITELPDTPLDVIVLAKGWVLPFTRDYICATPSEHNFIRTSEGAHFVSVTPETVSPEGRAKTAAKKEFSSMVIQAIEETASSGSYAGWEEDPAVMDKMLQLLHPFYRKTMNTKDVVNHLMELKNTANPISLGDKTAVDTVADELKE